MEMISRRDIYLFWGDEAMKISGRNKLTGRVVEVKKDDLMAQVTMDMDPGRVIATITCDSANELALAPGDNVTALVKASSVMVMK